MSKKERKKQTQNMPQQSKTNTIKQTQRCSNSDFTVCTNAAPCDTGLGASENKTSGGAGGSGKRQPLSATQINLKTILTPKKDVPKSGGANAMSASKKVVSWDRGGSAFETKKKYVLKSASSNPAQTTKKNASRSAVGNSVQTAKNIIPGAKKHAAGTAGCSRKANALFDTIIKVALPQGTKEVKNPAQQKIERTKKSDNGEYDERLGGEVMKMKQKKINNLSVAGVYNVAHPIDPPMPDSSTAESVLLRQYQVLLNELATGNPGLQNVIDLTLKRNANLAALREHLQSERGPEPKLPALPPSSSKVEGQPMLLPAPSEPHRLPNLSISQQSDNKSVLLQNSGPLLTNKNRRNKPVRPVDGDPLPAHKPTTLENCINKIVLNHVHENYPSADLRMFMFNEEVQSLPVYATQLIKHGIGRIVQGSLRVNAKNNHQSFVAFPKRRVTDRDAKISTLMGRQFALHGDLVEALVLDPKKSALLNTASVSDSDYQPEVLNNCHLKNTSETAPKNLCSTVADAESHKLATEYEVADAEPNNSQSPVRDTNDNHEYGELNSSLEASGGDIDANGDVVFGDSPKAFVIKVLEKVSRMVVGVVNFKNTYELFPGEKYYKVRPVDPRIPLIYVPTSFSDVHHRDIRGKYFYNVRINNNDDEGNYFGRLKKQIGRFGDVAAETRAILYKNGFGSIGPPMPEKGEEQVTYDINAELTYREDMRNKCVFTIDPLTARDLDDAMSIEKVGDDRYVVGVHIADVSFFMSENSPVDNEAKERATSIYLVNDVIHMLPEELCMKCSLLPNQEKLTFSVFFTFNGEGEVLGRPRITRSIIKCCAQLSYEHAQSVIDASQLPENLQFPQIYNGFERADIEKRVLELQNIATKLRKRRYDNGALSIHNPRFFVLLDPKTGEPSGFEREKRDTANFLIEEFMLLANQAVASTIYDHFPKIAFLRCHEAPILNVLQNLRKTLQQHGYTLDITSSKTIYESIHSIISASNNPESTEVGLSALLTRPMKRAEYFCTNGPRVPMDLRHYALSVPIYTHFTSPIRRYPDIIVHRLLAACCRYTAIPTRSPDELGAIARICNEQKLNAKTAGEESMLMYFKKLVKKRKFILERAAITEISRGHLIAICITTGIELSVTYKQQKYIIDSINAPYFLTVQRGKKNPLELRLFSPVIIRMSVNEGRLHGMLVFS